MKKILFLLGNLCFFTTTYTYSQVKENEVMFKDMDGKALLIDFLETKIRSDDKSINQFLKLQFACSDEMEFRFNAGSITVEEKLEAKKFQQFYKGIKVEFAVQNIVSQMGILTSLSGKVVQIKENTDINPKLTETEALHFALREVGAKEYMWEKRENEDFIKKEQNDMKATFYPTGELVIVEKDLFGKAPTPRLAYKFNVYAEFPLSRDDIYVDADNGEILLKNPIIEHVVGTGDTRYSGSRTFETQQVGNQYRLRDYSRGQGIETFNMNKSVNISSAVDFVDNNNNWTALEYNNANKDNAALDAHWGAQKTYDYLLQKHNRNSYDGNGAKIKGYVHYGSNYENARWTGTEIWYGDGGPDYKPFTSVDIVAHEIGHGLCKSTANLIPYSETGALNEGLSDVWGAMVEYFADPTKQTYLIGEEVKIGGGVIRSMSNPKSHSYPNTYGGQYWYTGTGNAGGIHINSGVLSHWFYILAEGKAGTNDLGNSYSIVGIGKDKAAKIVYRAEAVYFTATTNYAQARELTLQAAKDLYGVGSPEVIAVCQSWYAVGVGGNNCVSPLAITGNAILCNSAINYTYNALYVVNGSTVNWSVSTNALVVVNSTATSITVKPIHSSYNGIATITANVSGQLITKYVWIGKPLFTTASSPFSPPTVVVVHAVGLNGVNILHEGISNMVWELAPDNLGCGTISSSTGFSNEISYLTNPCITKLRVTATNTCGATQLLKSVVGSWQSGAAMLMGDSSDYEIYPMPSDSYLIIESSVNTTYQVTLSTNQGVQVFTTSTTDGICNIDVSTFQNGTYTLTIHSSQGIESSQLIINH